MVKVFVTGGSGFIGSHLVSKLLEMGYGVTNYDIAVSTQNTDANHIVGDIMDYDKLCRAMKGHQYVCHLAAMVGVVACQADPKEVYRLNYTGTENVLRSCNENRICNVLFASSSEVYGEGGMDQTLFEDTQLTPISAYGKAKRDAEYLIEQYNFNSGNKSTTLRYCNVYGPGQRTEFVVSIFINKWLNHEPLPVCDHGRQIRVYTYIDDAVDGTIKALLFPQKEYQVFNICSDDVLSVLEIAQKILAHSDEMGSIKYLDYAHINRDQKYEIIYRKPSNDKAIRLLKYRPQIRFDEGLARTIRYYQNISEYNDRS